MFQTVTDLRRSGFRVRIDRNGLTGVARLNGERFKIFRDPNRGWLFPLDQNQEVSA